MSTELSARVSVYRVEPASLAITAYGVTLDGNLIGYVWKQRGFSYRGMGGWNRGIRLRDFHPLEWRSGQNMFDVGRWAPSRSRGVRDLLEDYGGSEGKKAARDLP